MNTADCLEWCGSITHRLIHIHVRYYVSITYDCNNAVYHIMLIYVHVHNKLRIHMHCGLCEYVQPAVNSTLDSIRPATYMAEKHREAIADKAWTHPGQTEPTYTYTYTHLHHLTTTIHLLSHIYTVHDCTCAYTCEVCLYTHERFPEVRTP